MPLRQEFTNNDWIEVPFAGSRTSVSVQAIGNANVFLAEALAKPAINTAGGFELKPGSLPLTFNNVLTGNKVWARSSPGGAITTGIEGDGT